MPVRRTSFLSGSNYHVFNRGNSRRDIFLRDKDYERFLTRLKGFCQQYNVAILGYCLMPNHFHLLLKQRSELSISEMMRKLLVAYAMYFNIKYNNVGSPFQGRFKAKMVETDEYLLQVSRYIHQNPKELPQVKTGTQLGHYRWSSYQAYLGGVRQNFIDTKIVLDYFSLKKGKREDYREFVEEPLNEEKKKLFALA